MPNKINMNSFEILHRVAEPFEQRFDVYYGFCCQTFFGLREKGSGTSLLTLGIHGDDKHKELKELMGISINYTNPNRSPGDGCFNDRTKVWTHPCHPGSETDEEMIETLIASVEKHIEISFGIK